MDEPTHLITHHAILIGVNDYLHRPLKGCVRDVQNIKRCLKDKLHDAVEIETLTTSQTDEVRSFISAMSGTPWPSYANTTSIIEKVTERARPGSYVYIHYSGHGTQKPPSGDFSNESTGDLALVLQSGPDGREQYLWGFELASKLKTMADKGLVVTLVLDCCFSGSVYRDDDDDDDFSSRFLPYDAKRICDEDSTMRSSPSSSDFRDADMYPNWLLNPNQYAILAACGPRGKAWEPKFGGVKHGALSYLLVDVLERVGLSAKHKGIYDHLRAQFQKHGLPQYPVFYGNPNQGFFGETNAAVPMSIRPKELSDSGSQASRPGYSPASVPIIAKGDGTLILQAGSAHGISAGDEFTLFPLCTPGSGSQADITARVILLTALTSNLELHDRKNLSELKTGWMATSLTRLALRQFTIRLDPGVTKLSQWLTALKDRSLQVYNTANMSTYAFNVVLNNNNYRLLNESGQEIIKRKQDSTTIDQLNDIIHHLAQFRLMRELHNENTTDSFRQSFKVHVHHKGSSAKHDTPIEILHDTKLELFLENQGTNVLYFFIYDLGPSWQVENMNRGTYIVVEPASDQTKHVTSENVMSSSSKNRPGHIERKRLRMRIPERLLDEGRHSCEDIIKVFVTHQPTSFDLLELPRLGETAMAKPSATDGERMSWEGNELEDWAALNFPIRVVLE
ncbi:caspase domain-containing protein [Aspergillus pseudoustus]|uniref:Caspase domain-containing protein n=1 Tax=Aspergillus pseudoustus TaxID=1810923 RepID=A0ABR4JLT4_9EURO